GLCMLDITNKKFEFSGANHSMFLLRDQELYEIKGNRMPIGFSFHENKKFVDYPGIINKDDQFYLFTDGFLDQFGGDAGKKFGKSKFSQLIKKVNHLSMQDQVKEIGKVHLKWKGDHEQVDDILVIGFKI
ncbi:MAG: PP2C family protein-serine/threonine phosphatase, partial [bacterium]